MAFSLNFFDKHWKNKMNILFKEAKDDPQIFQGVLQDLKCRFLNNPKDPFVKYGIETLRFYIWPDSFKDDSLTLGPISTNTFKALEANYAAYRKNFVLRRKENN